MASAVKDLFSRLRGKPREAPPELTMPAHRLAALRSRALDGELPEPVADADTEIETEAEIAPDFEPEPEVASEEAFGAGPETSGDNPHGGDVAANDPGPRPVVLVRQRREPGVDWSGAASWFGGLPRLGDLPWPRGEDGTALPFAAQIGLAELAMLRPEAPLPKSGALAFFLGSGAVIHVPEDCDALTPAPDDLPPAHDENGFPFQPLSLLSRPVFPFWPVELLPIDLPDTLRDYRDLDLHEAIAEALSGAVAARVPRREYALGATSLSERLGGAPLPVWWHGVDHVVATLAQATIDASDRRQGHAESRNHAADRLTELEAAAGPDPEAISTPQATLTRLDELVRRFDSKHAGLRTMIQALEGFSAERDPWTALNDEEQSVLVDALATVRQQFGDFIGFTTVLDIRTLSVLSLRVMMTGEAAAFAAIPEPIREAINDNYRLPTQSLQQMFGLGANIQTAVDDHADDVLLLQLSYDDMMEWRFGDMGAYQFWIAPDDLAAQRWDRVTITFECG